MIIRKVELKNIRSHRNTIITFDRGITAITGRTGAGKSSILMAIEYCLFGTSNKLRGSSLLRRNANMGFVAIEIEEKGNIYRIERGLKRDKKGVTNDSSMLRLYKNGYLLPIQKRSDNFNEKILEILGYPKDIKPLELFETTCYAKQDEIRMLIDLRREERQEKIDSILQLSKYKRTFELLRDVIVKLEKERDLIKKEIESFSLIKEEFSKVKEKIEEIKKEVEERRSRLEQLKEIYDKEVRELEEKRKKYEEVLEKKKERENLLKNKEDAEERVKEIKKELEVEKENFNKKFFNISINALEKEKKEVEEELNSVKESYLLASKLFKEKELMSKDLRYKEDKVVKLEEEINFYRNKMNNIKLEEVRSEEEINKEVSDIKGKLFSINNEILRIKKEISSLSKIGGKCPLCLQEVKEEYRDKVVKQLKEEVERLIKEKEKLQKNLDLLNEELIRSLKNKELKKEVEKINILIKEKEKQKVELEGEISKIKEKLLSYSNIEEKFNKFKLKLKELESKFENCIRRIEEYKKIERIIEEKEKNLEYYNKKLLFIKSKLNFLEGIDEIFNKAKEEFINQENKVKTLEGEINKVKEGIFILEKELKELEEKEKKLIKEIEKINLLKGKLERINNGLDLIVRLREDIKRIREKVRLKFLKEFRESFLSKFEEIRKESEYIVDIKENYEPVAYANGVEVPISHLSGGEKTSVALAYRLALADIAAKMQSIARSELLILDEPTLGFDKEDIKALPEVLRNIKSIPQIIIVTHEDELRDAANVVYEIKKEDNISVVRKL